jgi:hypothetical protein
MRPQTRIEGVGGFKVDNGQEPPQPTVTVTSRRPNLLVLSRVLGEGEKMEVEVRIARRLLAEGAVSVEDMEALGSGT